MNSLMKIGLFILAELLINRIINFIFRLIAKKNHSAYLHFFKSVINISVAIIVLYSLVQQFDVTKDISRALLQSGTLLVAIATFAAQQALSNVISGLSLSVSKPYNVDDKIKVVQSGNVIAEGIVDDITIRHTIIRQYNGESCIVPNSIMDTAVVTNTNFIENVGNFLEIEVGYDADIKKAIQIIKKVCAKNELTLNTESNSVYLKGYTQNGVVLKTTVWTRNLDDSFQACSDIRLCLIQAFKNSGIKIPYHTVTVYKGEKVWNS